MVPERRKLTSRTASLDITTVKVSLEDDEYVLVFAAQQDYDIGESFTIDMDRFGVPATIDRDDIDIAVDDTPLLIPTSPGR